LEKTERISVFGVMLPETVATCETIAARSPATPGLDAPFRKLTTR
jgi:hypothetical protein